MNRPTDLEWLMSLGVSAEDVANRCGRTSTAIHAELDKTRRDREADD